MGPNGAPMGPFGAPMGPNKLGRPLFSINSSALRVPLGALMGPDCAPMGPDGAHDGQPELAGLVSGRVLQASGPAPDMCQLTRCRLAHAMGCLGAPGVASEISKAAVLGPSGA